MFVINSLKIKSKRNRVFFFYVVYSFLTGSITYGQNLNAADILNYGQDFNIERAEVLDSSNLPIIYIDTDGQNIQDGTKITARMKVFYNGDKNINRTTDEPEYNGFIGIEIRGRFSSTFPQKPYGFETRDSLGGNLSVSLLGMPKENDWILIPNYNDKSLVRNTISFEWFRRMGHYATRARLCEVVLNSQYRGIYVFCEKIKPDKNRVDIANLNIEDSTGEALTGGYIINVDYYGTDDNWVSSYPPFYYPDRRVHYNYVFPKPDEITHSQKVYIQNFIQKAEGVLYGENFRDTLTGYSKYVEVSSFIDYFIMSEVSRNVDGYKKSRFFYKDRQGKDSLLHAGPLWDFDWAWKNITECIFGNTDGSGWSYLTNDCSKSYAVPDWHIRLLQDKAFTNRLIKRYQSLRAGLLSLDTINYYIDSVKSYVYIAKDRHFALWPINAHNAAPEVEPPSKTYDEETARLKEWIRKRLVWLDTNIPKLRDNIISNDDTINISLINPGFEEPGAEKIKGWDGICADPNWTGLLYDIPGWESETPAFDSGVETGQGATEGLWTAFLMGRDTSVFQITDYRIKPGDEIGVSLDAKNNGSADLLEMSLFYVNGSNDKISIVSVQQDLTNVMTKYSISFNSADFPACINNKLGVSFNNVSSNSDSWLGLDNIKLFSLKPTAVEDEKNYPSGFSLLQNYPNPFNPVTKIHYSVAGTQHVKLKVYDILGNEIATLVNQEISPGSYEVVFDASQLSSGVYFYLLDTGIFRKTGKMVLLR